MLILKSLANFLAWRQRRSSIARVFAPTMGALHGGHAALLRRGRKLADELGGDLTASIFVNEKQFNNVDDFEKYPRHDKADIKLCRELGVDCLFIPNSEEIYPEDFSFEIKEKSIAQKLEGKNRLGHFDGVCAIVLKLFNIVEPTTAVFGEKDFQQLFILRKMVRDLNLSLEISAVATERENDGLAMSSRNRRLSAEERLQAKELFATLHFVAANAGEKKWGALRKSAMPKFLHNAPLANLQYLEAIDESNFALLSKKKYLSKSTRILIAAEFPSARLIDNIAI